MRRSGLLALVASLVLVAGCATATLLPNGRVLILSLVAKTYDPVAGRVVNSTQPPTMRLMATATALDNGLVLIAGGASGMATGFSLGGSDEPSGPQTYASADLYDPATDTYTPTGSMAHPRTFHTATLLADGRVLIVGGGETETTVGTTGPSTPQVVPPPELYDPATGTFGPTAGDTVAPHVLATATRLQDGRVLIAGGVTADLNAGTAGASPAPSPSGAPTTKAELFDPATGTFTATG
ncbi:MAG: kelch repeat-containing protein, partial [Candidatus Limnocylindrales bacterium]